MIEWLVYNVPWWLQGGLLAGLLVGGVLLLARFVGFKNALQVGAALAAVVGALTYGRRERQLGYQDREKKGDRDAQDALEAASRARLDAAARNGDAKRLRDDDGYRRD